jgi:NTE family protein
MAPDAHEAEGTALEPAWAVSLSLMGHDAGDSFAFSLLDRLLQDKEVCVKGIGAAGPGAVLAAVLAHGLTIGGRQSGRAAVAEFRKRAAAVSGVARLNYAPASASVPLGARGPGCDVPSAIVSFDLLDPAASPYEVPLIKDHPMKPVLEDMIDFDRLRGADAIKLFLMANSVRTGESRIFAGAEIGLATVLAAASVPFIHAAVEVAGEPYWYGGDAAWPELHARLRQSSDSSLIVMRDFARPLHGRRRARRHECS